MGFNDFLHAPQCSPWATAGKRQKERPAEAGRRVGALIWLQVFAVDLGHALEFFDVLRHAGVFVVEVLATLELVEAGLGVLALLDVLVGC